MMDAGRAPPPDMGAAVPSVVKGAADRAVASMSEEAIWEAFMTPVSVRESQVERAFLATARLGVRNFRGLELATYAWGGGPRAVFLVHGWGGRAAQLSAFVVPLIERGYRVVTMDAPGHGRSAGRQTSIFQFAEALVEAHREEGGFEAIIAHSMGATSATMAMGRGLPVRRAILVAPFCRLWDVLCRFASRVKLNAGQRERLIARLEGAFGQGMWDESSLVQVARQLTVPALVVHDRGDVEIPYQDSVATAAAWRGSALLTTEGLGHRLILRDPEVVRQIVAFVDA